MPDEVDKTVESNVEGSAKVVAEESADSTVKATELPEQKETTEEEVDFGGKKFKKSEVDRIVKDYENDSKWKEKNKRESEELNRERTRLSRLELLDRQLEQRPEILQQLLAPKPQRDFEKEWATLYQQAPDPAVDPAGYNQWAAKLESLRTERIASVTQENLSRQFEQQRIGQANYETEAFGKDKYLKSGKVDDSEFQQMNQWIVNSVRPANGVYPKEAYDAAYKLLFEDKWLQDVKLDATRKAIDPILKARSKSAAGDNGGKQKEVQATPQDDDDRDFVAAVRSKTRNWTTVPT